MHCKHLKILSCDESSVRKEVTKEFAAVSFQLYLDPTSWCLRRMVWEVLACCSRQAPPGFWDAFPVLGRGERCSGPSSAACMQGCWWGVASVWQDALLNCWRDENSCSSHGHWLSSEQSPCRLEKKIVLWFWAPIVFVFESWNRSLLVQKAHRLNFLWSDNLISNCKLL